MKNIFVFILVSFVILCAKDYSGAELFSLESFKYGKFEAKMKMPAGSALVSSMFLYYDDSWLGGGEPWVEIDIEVLGKSPQSFQSNIISGSAEKQVMSEKHHALDPAASEVYYIYAIEWTPTYVAWFVNGVEMRRTEVGSTDLKNQVENLVKAQSLRFNLWSSTVPAWVGPWDESILPVQQFIDWVKVYEYTPNADSVFSLLWVDEFEFLDESRWGKGDWTFDDNRVTMHPSNVQVQDGVLVLSMTKLNEEGFNGEVPSSIGIKRQKAPKHTLKWLRTFDLNGRYKASEYP